MKSKIFIATVVSILALTSCSKYVINPSGIIVKDTRYIAAFHKVEVEDGLNVEIVMSDAESVIVEADDNVVPYIETSVDEGELEIKIKDDIHIKGRPHIKVTVNVTELLNDISGSSGSHITSMSELDVEDLNLTLSGGSHFDGALITNKTSLSLSGGSTMITEGRSTTLNMNCSGGSTVKGSGLATDDVYANLSGGSTTDLRVNQTIQVTASGGSEFRYSGNAMVTKQDLSGGSKVAHY